MKLKMCNCVILCGGKSSRMKQDKALLSVENKALTQILYDRFKPLFKEVFISAKNDKFKANFKLILDESEIYSPMIALNSVLKNFKNEFVFITCVDYVSLSENEINKLFLSLKEHLNAKAVLAKTPLKTHFLCGFFHSSLSFFCEDFIKENNHKIANLITKINANFVEFESEKAFVNLNYYEDFLKYKKEIL